MRGRKLLTYLLTSVLITACLAGCGKKAQDQGSSEVAETETTASPESTAMPEATAAPEEKKESAAGELLSGKHHAEIEIKDYGIIKLELDADAAPVTVTNFLKLAKDGFYDGLTFHRIISGFMIQGGDPNGDGTGGSEQTIKGEFQSNGVANSVSHTRGTISMARTADNPDSASSQFFIVQGESPHLDGDYAGFGHVTEGIEIVDQICQKVQPIDGNGTVEKENQPVITTVRAID